MQVTRDMNNCAVTYINMDQSKNKGT